MEFELEDDYHLASR